MRFITVLLCLFFFTSTAPIQTVFAQMNPVVHTRWGTYDLRTWRRQCSSMRCQMCLTLDSLQHQYFTQGTFNRNEVKEAGQKPAPKDVAEESIKLLELDSEDVLADFGCGDASVLIDAINKYGCNGVGIEIDPEVFAKAYTNVHLAEKSGKIPKGSIALVYGDVLEFDEKEPIKFPDGKKRINKVYAYLYQDLLNKLADKFKNMEVVSMPFHRPNSLRVWKYDDIYVYKQVEPVEPVKPNGRWEYRKFCQNGRCFYQKVWVQSP